jgi:hypothetical protein
LPFIEDIIRPISSTSGFKYHAGHGFMSLGESAQS